MNVQDFDYSATYAPKCDICESPLISFRRYLEEDGVADHIEQQFSCGSIFQSEARGGFTEILPVVRMRECGNLMKEFLALKARI